MTTARELLQELVDALDEGAPNADWTRQNRAIAAARAYLSAVPQTEPLLTEAGSDGMRALTTAGDAMMSRALMRSVKRKDAAAPQERAIPRERPYGERHTFVAGECAECSLPPEHPIHWTGVERKVE